MSCIEHHPESGGPCPFCRTHDVRSIEIDTGVWAVYCRQCGAIGPNAGSQQLAVQKWSDGQAASCSDS